MIIMPVLKYTGDARIFRTATPDGADEENPRMVTVERDESRMVDVDEATADKLLNLGVFEIADDVDNDGEPDQQDTDRDNFSSLEGIGSSTESDLFGAGYATFDDLRDASDDELLSVEGVGEAAVNAIRSNLDDSSPNADETPTDGGFDIGG